MSNQESSEYKYWAFISYSHQDNLAVRGDGSGDHIPWANWLQEELETFLVPDSYRDRPAATGELMPERFNPAFRDEAELPTSHDLGGQIHDALRRSRFLIVIASPRSAASRYVNEEVRYFRQLGRGDRILTLIVDGEPNVRLRPKAGWTAGDDCFCPALVHPLRVNGSVDESALLPEEPIAADVRVKDAGPPREMRASERVQPERQDRLDFMKLKLVAGLMGVGLDDLVQRDKRRAEEQRVEKARQDAELAAINMRIQELERRPAHVIEAPPEFIGELKSAGFRCLTDPSNWEDLLIQMEAGRVIPILGSELFAVPTEEGLVAVADLIARDLACRYNVPWNALRGSRALSHLYRALRPNDRRSQIRFACEVRNILDELKLPLAPPYKVLASMHCWPVVFSGGFDQQLEHAFLEAGLRPRPVNFGRHFRESFPKVGSSIEPILFNFLGTFSKPWDCAVTENHELEFMVALQECSPHDRSFFDDLLCSDFLVLGGGYGMATLHELLQVLKVFKDDMGHIYLHSSALDGRAESVHQFSDANVVLLPPDQSVIDFLAELNVRWLCRNPAVERDTGAALDMGQG